MVRGMTAHLASAPPKPPAPSVAQPSPPTGKSGGPITPAPAPASRESKALTESEPRGGGVGARQSGGGALGGEAGRRRKKSRRLALPLAQIPSSFVPTLKPVSGDLQIYTHPHAVIFENEKTTVQLGLYDGDTPVAVKQTKWPKDEEQRKKALREKARATSLTASALRQRPLFPPVRATSVTPNPAPPRPPRLRRTC